MLCGQDGDGVACARHVRRCGGGEAQAEVGRANVGGSAEGGREADGGVGWSRGGSYTTAVGNGGQRQVSEVMDGGVGGGGGGARAGRGDGGHAGERGEGRIMGNVDGCFSTGLDATVESRGDGPQPGTQADDAVEQRDW